MRVKILLALCLNSSKGERRPQIDATPTSLEIQAKRVVRELERGGGSQRKSGGSSRRSIEGYWERQTAPTGTPIRHI